MTTLHHHHHHHHDSPFLSALQALTLSSTLFLAGSLTTTTLHHLPPLLLATHHRARTPTRPSSSSGRLTPQPTRTTTPEPRLDLLTPSALGSRAKPPASYHLAAKQFTLMVRTARTTQVPLELLALLAAGYLAYHRRSRSWAVVAASIASVFPVTGLAMVPVERKLARLAGWEEAVEPYEDALLVDREEERGNAEGFLRAWGWWNAVRGVLMVGAGGVGVWSVLG